MNGFLNVENEQIGRLGSQQAVELFRDILWAEARRLGILPEIRISERITAPDGGIDASSNNTTGIESELIKANYSGFQIKTGTTFVLTDGALQNELFRRNQPVQKENLGESVVHCLDANGYLTFVCFGLDPNEQETNRAITKIKEWLATCGYQNAIVRIWGQTTIKGFLGDFPSIRLMVNGRGSGGVFETLDGWKMHGDMKPEVLTLGEPQKEIIQEIREQLLANTDAIHLRIVGESGVGKTRLVLESLNEEKIRSLVVYTDNPSQLENQGFLGQIGMADNAFEIVLVLDECSQDVAVRYWNRVQSLGKRIRLITIYNEGSERAGTTKLLPIPPLGDDQVAQILKQYGVPEEHVRRWASFCEGSPRWAGIIGENLQSNSKDILKEPDNVPVINRYIAGTDDPTSQAVRERMLIMRFLSLFKRFGFKPPVAEEATAIFGLVNKYDNSITRARFDEHIKNLHDRKILQGEKTYYITPKPLQVKLWIEWWDQHSAAAFDINDFTKLPPALISGFNEMFRFAQESQAAMKTVEYLLGDSGPFADGLLLKEERESDFFLALAEAAPEKALERLETTVAKWNNEQLLEFKTGRRQVIWAIERIAVWEGLFVRAMRVLLRLAEAENDRIYSNNATGTFKDFFSIFTATEESPLIRLPLLEELLFSKDPVKENIAIQALSLALENHFTRAVGAEYQGIRREPHLWDPREHPKETREYTNKVWEMLMAALNVVTENSKNSIMTTLMHQTQVFGRNPGSSELALDSARKILQQGGNKNDLIEAVVHILYYGHDELPQEIKSKWEEFYKELVPDDLSSLLNRYVAMNLTEDYFRKRDEYDEQGKEKRIADLADKAYQDQSELLKNIPWLVTDEAGNGYVFGHALGEKDKEKKLLNIILEARRNTPEEKRPSQYFLGGYLRTIFEENPSKWELLFGDLSKEELFVPLLPELAWRAGITDQIMENILSLVEDGKINPVLLSHFKYGVSIRELGEKTLEQFVMVLMGQSKKITSSIALDVFSRYYVDKESGHEIPKDLTLAVLTDPMFFAESDERADVMDDYTWSQTANKFLEKYGADKEAVVKIGTLMLNSLGNSGSIVDHADRYVRGILMKISEAYPNELWLKALDSLEEKGYFIFKHWLSSNEFFDARDHANPSVIGKIKLDALWAWIDKDVEKRAWFIANMVPNVFSNDPGQVCLAREILIRYGDREDVRRNLAANFFTEGWSGEASEHHKKMLEAILPLRKKETDQRVIRWLDDYINQRKRAIENAKTEEERSDF
ncbi:MAG: hypothetical protein LiPW15_619 [Parcubacteria group bacterium LiPW_15]|nr:MAG: hypothetical protein LiPW15_619 [Parcubacteria group bacterium LiPW_15]